jgi:hypothetical protein
MKVMLSLVNGFSVLNGLFLALWAGAFAQQHGCDLVQPSRKTLFTEITCFPTIGFLWPVLVIMPFVVASAFLLRRGQTGPAMLIALLPAVTFLLLWVLAASQPFGFGG